MLNALSDKQKCCRKNSQGTNDQLYIDKMVLREAKSSKKNLEIGLIDYKKAYDMIPHPGILECLGLFGVAQKNYDVTERFREWLANGTYIIWEESRKCLHQKRHFPVAFPVPTPLRGLHDPLDPHPQEV